MLWKDAQENHVTDCCNLGVVKDAFNSKLFLEWSQQMRLTCRNDQAQVMELVFNLEQLGEEHSADLTAADDTNFESWKLFLRLKIAH